MSKIPLARAFSKTDKRLYVGHYVPRNKDYPNGEHYIMIHGRNKLKSIDPETLAICFPDRMRDESNRHMYASVNHHGIGGDIIEVDGMRYYLTFDDCGVMARQLHGEWKDKWIASRLERFKWCGVMDKDTDRTLMKNHEELSKYVNAN